MDYKKRPLWQWVLIYLVGAGVVYALVYFVFIKGLYSSPKSSSSSNNPYSSSSQTTTKPIPTNSQPSTPQNTTPPPSNSNPPANMNSSASFTITADDNGADKESISVAKGTTVSLTFKVKDNTVYHGGLDFRSNSVSTGTIAPGQSKTIQFTAGQSFKFIPYWPSSNIQKGYTISINVA